MVLQEHRYKFKENSRNGKHAREYSKKKKKGHRRREEVVAWLRAARRF